jgi:hypothetical protein
MPPEEGPPRQEDWPWQPGMRAELEQLRAARAAAQAAWHDARADSSPESIRAIHVRMADLHRQTEQRHRASAAAHQMFAGRMSRWVKCVEGTLMPVFLAGVAGMVGTDSALAVLRSRHGVAAAAVSDRIAQAAHDAERVTAQGPALEAAGTGAPVMAAGHDLDDRWPLYGAAVAELGVASVVATPLRLGTAELGVLCALGQRPFLSDGAAVILDGIAAALTHELLGYASQTPVSASGSDGPVQELFGSGSAEAAISQAAGMVSVQCGGSIDDAAALLAARAFADGAPVAEVARQVLRGEISFAVP